MILIWMLKDKRENTNLREYCRSALNHHSLTLGVVVFFFLDDDILLAHSSNTSRINTVMREFYSVSLTHTIDQCRPYYPSEPLSLCLIQNQVFPEYTVFLAPLIHTILILQMFAHTDIKSLGTGH